MIDRTEEAFFSAEAPGVTTCLANGCAGTNVPTQNGQAKHTPTTFDRLLKRIRSADEWPEVALRWLWPGRVPMGQVTAMIGPRGAAKSYLIAEIAARLSNGDPWPDQPDIGQEPAEALILSAEDDLDGMIKPRLRACGADLNKVRVLDTRIDAEDDEPAELSVALVEAIADRFPNVKLIVVDPFAELLARRNDRRYADVKDLLDQLARFAERRGIAVILVNATDKVSRGRTWQHGVDVLPFLEAGTRAVWTLEPDPGEVGRFYWLNARANHAGRRGREGLAFTIDEASGKVAWDPEPIDVRPDDFKPAAHARVTKVARAAAWLRGYLAGGPRPAADVLRDAALAGLPHGALHEAKRRLGIVSNKTATANGGWVWSMTERAETQSRMDSQPSAPCAAAELRQSAEADGAVEDSKDSNHSKAIQEVHALRQPEEPPARHGQDERQDLGVPVEGQRDVERFEDSNVSNILELLRELGRPPGSRRRAEQGRGRPPAIHGSEDVDTGEEGSFDELAFCLPETR
jgi:hypothetical protein